MKRNSEESFGQDAQSKRLTTSIMPAQHIPQVQTQQSAPVMSPYQFVSYPGNLMYTRPPQWPPQSGRYEHPTNLPPPPVKPPPVQPPPPPPISPNQMSMPIFDLTQPPPPIRPNCAGTSNVLPGTSSLINVLPNPCAIRPMLRGRGTNFRGTQIRQRINLRNIPSNNTMLNNTNMDDTDGKRILVNRKSKRKPMSARYMRSKEWDRKDAEKALALENDFNKMQRTPMLILKFPDPEINKHIVKKYSTAIETVHFQQPSTPRYCFVTLKDGNDIEKTRKELSEIPFGTGKIIAEQKFTSNDETQPVSPEEIDPYTLYIGNLPTKVCVKTVKEHFPGAARIDIGYAQRMKYTRYAFIRYNNVEDAMEAYKRTFNTPIGNRSLIVRFRRSKGNIGLPGESRIPNAPKKAPEVVKEGNNPKEDTAKIPKPNCNQKIIDISHETEENRLPVVVNSDESEVEEEEEEEEDDEEEDSKENVLNEARKIRLDTQKTKRLEDRNFVIKQETDEGYENNINQSRQNRNNSCKSNITTSLLGTRIKEEPMDDDELLACARTYNLEDDYNADFDFDDEEPEEEDDFLDNRSDQNMFSYSLKSERSELKQKDNAGSAGLPNPLDETDVKPDFSNLQPFPYTTSTYGYNSNRYEYPRNQTNFYGIKLDKRTNENGKKDDDKEDEDDDDMFDDLNAEDDFDVVGNF